ncbi:hypothetical protein SCHPADRAFT_993615 [Schizopora paradoxa]|uniref:EGF-like domain-containing protein n=1 Tax=Schizopora paradoxa TaxID=27342 RepID=A0A0H2S218_9AGAM|nr:hypothetical protein SCHPADRAFT_993615 [Schizopora paradoxa]
MQLQSLFCFAVVFAQQLLHTRAEPLCFNGGFANSSSNSCVCEVGFSGSDCSSVKCGGNPFDVTRPVVGQGSSINDCPCGAGWTGVDCDICTSLTSCDTAYKAAGGQYSSTPGSNTTLTCNSAPVVVNVGSTSCIVNDSALTTDLGDQTLVTFQRREKPQRSPFANENTQNNDSSSISLQIWNNGTEQISCFALPCSSLNDLDSSHLYAQWDCQNISCACLPGSTFCDSTVNGSNSANLTSFVNSITGNVSVRCPPTQNEETGAAPVSTCAITQDGISAMFNITGDIMLSSCAFGECVWQDDFTGEGLNKTTSSPSSSASGGSGRAFVGWMALLVGQMSMMNLLP